MHRYNLRFSSLHLITLLLVTGTIATAWLLWKLPQVRVDSEPSLTSKERIELENSTRNSLSQAFGTLSQTIGGVVLVVGVYFTWRNLIAVEEKQVTERFTRAIDQLGSDKVEICVGGIYALERIAEDSRKDHWVVMEVLASFVKSKASSEKNIGNQKQVAREIQAALTVIKRRDSAKDPKNKTLDFSSTYLKGADLQGANLEGADFTGANLEGACFIKANLGGSEFTRANVSRADFTGALTIAAKFTNAINTDQAKGLELS